MKSKPFTTIAASIFVMAAIPSTQAAISIGGVAFWSEENDTGTGASGIVVSENFDASAFDKLVVVITGESGFPGVLNADATSVTYDGVALNTILNRRPIDNSGSPTPLGATIDQTYQGIYYLDNPTTSTGLIQATWVDNNVRGSVAVYGMNGTDVGFGNTVIGAQEARSVNLTTGAGSIVLGSLGLGGNGNTGATSSVDTVDPTNFIETTAQSESTWDGQVTAYQINSLAGTNSYGFTGGSVIGSHIVAAEFTPIPEPSAALLGCFGLLGLLRRRR